jgi:hypothetical protein
MELGYCSPMVRGRLYLEEGLVVWAIVLECCGCRVKAEGPQELEECMIEGKRRDLMLPNHGTNTSLSKKVCGGLGREMWSMEGSCAIFRYFCRP